MAERKAGQQRWAELRLSFLRLYPLVASSGYSEPVESLVHDAISLIPNYPLFIRRSLPQFSALSLV